VDLGDDSRTRSGGCSARTTVGGLWVRWDADRRRPAVAVMALHYAVGAGTRTRWAPTRHPDPGTGGRVFPPGRGPWWWWYGDSASSSISPRETVSCTARSLGVPQGRESSAIRSTAGRSARLRRSHGLSRSSGCNPQYSEAAVLCPRRASQRSSEDGIRITKGAIRVAVAPATRSTPMRTAATCSGCVNGLAQGGFGGGCCVGGTRATKRLPGRGSRHVQGTAGP